MTLDVLKPFCKDTIEFDVPFGWTIEAAVTFAMFASKTTGINIAFKFNGVEMSTADHYTIQSMLKLYWTTKRNRGEIR